MRLIDRLLLSAVRWRLAQREPGTRDDFGNALLNLAVGDLVVKSGEARALQTAGAQLELRTAAFAAFEEMSISESEVRQ